jgi:hypothetical protein
MTRRDKILARLLVAGSVGIRRQHRGRRTDCSRRAAGPMRSASARTGLGLR